MNHHCPFCGQAESDLVGLKHHILNYCEVFNAVDSLLKVRLMDQKRDTSSVHFYPLRASA